LCCSPPVIDFIEGLCDRFILAQEATGLSRVAFGRRVGLTGPQVTNISRYRNPPSHEAIHAACREFGYTANWFYEGSRVGLLDTLIAERLRLREGQSRQ
jgi:transcriptional regulator with XRE-family HTH domain